MSRVPASIPWRRSASRLNLCFSTSFGGAPLGISQPTWVARTPQRCDDGACTLSIIVAGPAQALRRFAHCIFFPTQRWSHCGSSAPWGPMLIDAHVLHSLKHIGCDEHFRHVSGLNSHKADNGSRRADTTTQPCHNGHDYARQRPHGKLLSPWIPARGILGTPLPASNARRIFSSNSGRRCT